MGIPRRALLTGSAVGAAALALPTAAGAVESGWDGDIHIDTDLTIPYGSWLRGQAMVKGGGSRIVCHDGANVIIGDPATLGYVARSGDFSVVDGDLIVGGCARLHLHDVDVVRGTLRLWSTQNGLFDNVGASKADTLLDIDHGASGNYIRRSMFGFAAVQAIRVGNNAPTGTVGTTNRRGPSHNRIHAHCERPTATTQRLVLLEGGFGTLFDGGNFNAAGPVERDDPFPCIELARGGGFGNAAAQTQARSARFTRAGRTPAAVVDVLDLDGRDGVQVVDGIYLNVNRS